MAIIYLVTGYFIVINFAIRLKYFNINVENE
jgi:hypothetical protein